MLCCKSNDLFRGSLSPVCQGRFPCSDGGSDQALLGALISEMTLSRSGEGREGRKGSHRDNEGRAA